jgi:BPG-independent PGAM N-terminus (iPGM_N)
VQSLQLQSGDIFKHKGWEGLKLAFEKHTLHFIGLLSDGGVHSRYDQLLLCLQGARLQMLRVPSCAWILQNPKWRVLHKQLFQIERH